MAVGTIRTVTRSVTVGPNTTRSFSAVVNLPASYSVKDFVIDNPNLDIVLLSINGRGVTQHGKAVVQDGDKVTLVLANETAGSITAGITITLIEHGAPQPV